MWSGLPGQADIRNFTIAELPPLPAVESGAESHGDDQLDPLNVGIASPGKPSLTQLATSLGLMSNHWPISTIVPMNHVFESGTWFAVSSDQSAAASTLGSVAADSVRTSAPPIAPPPVASTAKVQSGDSLTSFLARHGIKEIELKRLNPGLAIADISVGLLVSGKSSEWSELLAIRPTTSGGASWPNTPACRIPRRFQV